ncbi:MAG: RNA polymerase sigma factor [Planctomycetes bacterium]|nr:RNA polymerase sigma factor [Planctomycetota bacterium]
MPPTTSNPAPPEGDAEIVRLLRDRQQAGLHQLLAVHGPRVRGGLKRSFGDSLSAHEIEAAINQAAYRAWRSAESFAVEKGSLRAWFYVIARNASLELLRDQQRRRWETRGDDVEQIATATAGEETGEALPPRFLDTLRRCIAELPRLQRRIIEADLRTGDVADATELARELKTTKNSIYVSRSMARKALKNSLLEHGYVPGEGKSQALWN